MSRLIGLIRRPVVWLPISAGLLAILTWRSRIWEAPERLRLERPELLVLAVGLNGIVVVLWAMRSADLLAAAGRAVSIAPLVPMTAFANTINNLTPGSLGEIARVWFLRVHHAVDVRTGTAIVLVERVVALGYLGGSSAVLWSATLLGWPAAATVLLLAAIAALPWAVYRGGMRPSRIVVALPVGRLLGHERWARGGVHVVAVDTMVARILARPDKAARFAGSTALVFACYAGQLVLVAASLGLPLSLPVAWGALGLGITAGVLSLLPFGLGSTDLVLVALLGAVGVDAITATAVAFGYRLVATLPLGLLGVASYGWLSARLPADGSWTTVLEIGPEIRAGEPAGEP